MAPPSHPTAQSSITSPDPSSRSSSPSPMNIAYVVHPIDQYSLFKLEHKSSIPNSLRSNHSTTSHSPASSLDSRSARSRPSFDSSSTSGSINCATGSPTSSVAPLLSFRPKQTALKPSSFHVQIPSTSILDPTLDTPTSPEFPQISEAARRRRQLEKVARTLGEDIPAELILQAPARHSTSTPPAPKELPHLPTQAVEESRRRKRDKLRRASVSLSSLTSKLRQTGPQQSRTSSDEYNDASDKFDPRRYGQPLPRPESIMLTPITFAFPPDPIRVKHDKGKCGGIDADDDEAPTPVESLTRSHSFSHSSRQQHHSHSHSPSEPFADPYLRPETPFMDSILRHDHANVLVQETSVVRKERRQGWSGEWNQVSLPVYKQLNYV